MAFVLTEPTALARILYFKKENSVERAVGDLIAANAGASADDWLPASATTEFHIGVVMDAIASTDSDYADEALYPLLVDEFGEWEVDVGTGTADVNDEQGYIDLKDEETVDVEASAIDAFFVTRFISGTKVRGKICSWAWCQRPVDS